MSFKSEHKWLSANVVHNWKGFRVFNEDLDGFFWRWRRLWHSLFNQHYGHVTVISKCYYVKIIYLDIVCCCNEKTKKELLAMSLAGRPCRKLFVIFPSLSAWIMLVWDFSSQSVLTVFIYYWSKLFPTFLMIIILKMKGFRWWVFRPQKPVWGVCFYRAKFLPGFQFRCYFRRQEVLTEACFRHQEGLLMV